MNSFGQALELKNIRKTFPGTVAVDGVDFDLLAGEVHALVGENGAGKSTLMKIIAGAYPDYAGEILINGLPVKLHSPAQARQYGIGMIYQELSLARPLSLRENVLAGRLPVKAGFLLDRKKADLQTRAALKRVGLDLDPDLTVAAISQHEAQLVEIAKALHHHPCILVMDEPTSALSRAEVDRLFEIIRKLRNEGLAIIYISHHLPEIFRIADRVTVLRDGKKIATRAIGDVTPEKLIEMMVGRAADDLYYAKPARTPGREMLTVRNLSRFGFFHDVSLTVHAGEIVGLGGLAGAGRTELARVLVGADRADAGEIRVEGKPVRLRQMSDALEAGLAYLSEDRKSQGLALRLTVAENALAALIPRHSTWGIYRPGRGAGLLDQLLDDLQIHPRDPALQVRNLSGGNQQKVLLAKWLALQPRVLILDEPTRGVDIGAKVLIHRVVEKLAEQGHAVILISSDLPELVTLSDRILVLRRGHLVQELPKAECDEETVLRAATGGDGHE